jgi:hypothetical protein
MGVGVGAEVGIGMRDVRVGAGAGAGIGMRGVGRVEAGAVTDAVSVIGAEAGVKAMIGTKAHARRRTRTVRSTTSALGAAREADAGTIAAGTTTKSRSASTILLQDARRRVGRGRIDSMWEVLGSSTWFGRQLMRILKEA